MKAICQLMTLPLLFWFALCGFSAAQKIEDGKTWSVKCGGEGCMLVSSKVFKEQRVSQIRLYNVGDQEIVEFLLPLGFNIKEGVFLKIDGNHALPTHIVACEEKGCTGFLVTSQEIIRDMMKGKNMSLVFTSFSDRRLYSLNYTLMGFTKAYREAKRKYR